MSDEIQKAQQIAIDLKVHELIKNVITKANTTPNLIESEWEGCHLDMTRGVFSITMPNGVVLYKATLGFFEVARGVSDVNVTDFRYGTWVEKLKSYSEQIDVC